jgi:hypothetical protein
VKPPNPAQRFESKSAKTKASFNKLAHICVKTHRVLPLPLGGGVLTMLAYMLATSLKLK